MWKSRPCRPLSTDVGDQRDASPHTGRLLAVAGPHEEGLVTSYRDIFPDKFYELVKIHLAFLIELSVEYLSEEVHIEASPRPVTSSLPRACLFDDDSATSEEDDVLEKERSRSKTRKTRFLARLPLGKLLHHLQRAGRRGASGDRDHSEGPVEILCIREEQVNNFVTVIDSLVAKDRFVVEGLFRKAGNTMRHRQLEALICSPNALCPAVLSRRYSTHDVAAALKSSLQRLAEPLLTSRFAPLFAAVARLSEERRNEKGQTVPFAPGDLSLIGAKQVKALRLLFLLLPDTNRELLQYLLSFLSRVAAQGETRMSPSSLGLIFGPSLFLGSRDTSAKELNQRYRMYARCVTLMIEKADELAKVPLSVAVDVGKNLSRISQDPVATCVRYASGPATQTEPDVRDATQLAVAKLYAEVARWPDSERKRSAIRRLNNLNGGLTPSKSPCVDYVHRSRLEKSSNLKIRAQRRIFQHSDVSHLSIPNALHLSTPVSRVTDLPSLISFSDPLSPDERAPRWGCSPVPRRLTSQSELPPLVTQ